MPISDPTVAFERLLAALDHLGVRYVVGGSLASSIRGSGRATMDIDLVVELGPAQADQIVPSLEDVFIELMGRAKAGAYGELASATIRPVSFAVAIIFFQNQATKIRLTHVDGALTLLLAALIR